MAQKNRGAWLMGLVLLFGIVTIIPYLNSLLPDFAVEDEMVALQGFYGLVHHEYTGFAFLKYPGLLFIVLALALYPAYLVYNFRTLIHLKTFWDMKFFLSHPRLPDASAIYLGRVESLIAGLAAAWILFVIFRKRIGDRASLFAGLFMVASPAWMFSCSILKNDTLLLLGLMVLLYAGFGIMERGKNRDYLLAGFALGLCLAAKLHIFALVPLLAGHWLRSGAGNRFKTFSKQLAYSLAVALAVFFILSPFQLLHPARTLHAALVEMAFQSRALPLFKARDVWYQAPILFQLLCVFPFAMGILAYLLFLAGLAGTGRYLERKELVLFISYPAVFFIGWAAISRLGYPHLYLPLVPFFSIPAGIAVDQLLAKKFFFRAAGILLALVSVLLNIFSIRDLNRAQNEALLTSLDQARELKKGDKIAAFLPYRPIFGNRYENDFNFLPQFALSLGWLEKNHPRQVLVHQTYYLSCLAHPEITSPRQNRV